MTYRYQGYTAERKLITGTIEAVNETLAAESLYHAGIKYIISLKPARAKPDIYTAIPSLFGVKPQDIIDFSRQLASFVASGVAIHAALQLVTEQTTKPALKRVLTGIEKEIQAGSSFSQAVHHYPDQFPYAYYQIIKASEQAGELETGLRQIADSMEKQLKTRASIRRALTYPLLVTVMAIGIFFLMITVVLPPILELFRSLNADLPLPTRMVMGLTSFFGVAKWYLLGGIVLVVTAFWGFARLPSGRLWFDKMALRMPFTGKIVIQRTMANFCRTTYMMLKAGMQLPAIMDVVTQTTTTNRVVIKALEELRAKLVEGQGFSRPMSENSIFPPTMVKMISMGEQTGTLEESINTLANFYEERANQSVQSLVAMIEPTITIVMGLGVAFILVSILLPMYKVLSSLR
ncbi:MAG: type II secretion system F family protein [Dehalococcoidales bacterium]|nr:type II secretion system F family protein [Dehalococcoidales bacterium]